MAIHIPEELEQSVQQLADRLGFAKDDFVRDAVAQRLAEYEEEPVLTEAQIARMRESIAQLDRGEYVTSEEVEAKFNVLFEELEARAKREEQSPAVTSR